MSATAEARFVGGILAARGTLRPDLTVDDALAALERLVGPETVWCTALPEYEGWERFDAAVGRPPALWAEPESSTLDAAADVLDAAFEHVRRLTQRPVYVEPVLRVAAVSLADAEAVRSFGLVDGLPIAAYVQAQMGRWTWRWPLRVGVVAADPAATIAALTGQGEYAEHYELTHLMPGDPSPADLLVVDWRLVGRLESGDFGRVGAALVTRPVGDDTPIDTLFRRVARSVRPGAIVALADDELGWFEPLVRELSHDRTLDAAVGLAVPDALMIGDSEFLATTSIRNWAIRIAEQADRRSDGQLATDLRRMIAELPFERESGGARELGHRVRDGLRDGTVVPIEGERDVRAAIEPDPAPDEAASSDATAPPDDRRLVSRVTDAQGNIRSNGFVAGRVHRLQLRIAAEAGEGETAASEMLTSPRPGTDVPLEVTVHVEGSTKRLPPVELVHPASGDGDWTVPMSFAAPRRDGDLRVFISVAWRGRVIQSATLTGPLRGPDHADDPGEFRFDVDRSAGTGDIDARPAADATIIQVPPSDRRPAILGADSVVPIDPRQLEKANDAVRKVLIDTFLEPPASLQDAAGRLTLLALRGSLLRDALRGKDRSFYDDASWIHVMSFGGPPINFELIYTHPMPSKKSVPICDAVTGGATSCTDDCPDRASADCVCPFGFWATTKVVERRLHASDRNDSSASDQRVVAVRDGGAVGVADVANADDPNASARIVRAVTSFVLQGTGVEATTWDELEGAVRSHQRQLLCLVTHTIEPDDPDDDLGVELQLGGDTKELLWVDEKYVNPALRTPGPVVLALGCDTATISASFASFVSRLHSIGAEIVVSAISQIPGKEAADFVERFTARLGERLSTPGPHRFGEVMTAVRAETLLQGDVMALALTASGDGDVCLQGTP